MKFFFTLILLTACAAAHADVWMWVDARGNTHFVDSNKPIFTWVDESGEVHYSDSPDHEDAVSVELVWHAAGTRKDPEASSDGSATGATTDAVVRKDPLVDDGSDEYYCQRASEIYESYINAPQLYRTNAAGEREFLSEQETADTIAETKARRDELCG